MTCPTCGCETHEAVPPEPPEGTWVRDRFGGTTMHHVGGGWAPKGCLPVAKWEPMWHARGPLVQCGPWGQEDPA